MASNNVTIVLTPEELTVVQAGLLDLHTKNQKQKLHIDEAYNKVAEAMRAK